MLSVLKAFVLSTVLFHTRCPSHRAWLVLEIFDLVVFIHRLPIHLSLSL